MGQGAGHTHPGHQRALQEELHELGDRHVHAEAVPAGSSPRVLVPRGPRHKAALAAGAGLRRLAPGRQRRGASPRSAASAAPRPAPRPGLGEGEGPPLGEEQCGRRPRPSAALGGRRAASRCRGPEPGRGRGCAGRQEGAVARTCVGGGGVRAARTWGCSRTPTRSAAAERLGPQHVALPCARASAAGPPRQVRVGARQRWPRLVPPRVLTRGTGSRGALPAEVGPCAPHAGGPAELTSRKLKALGRCSPSAAQSTPPPAARCRRSPAQVRGVGAKPARLTCWAQSRPPVGAGPEV